MKRTIFATFMLVALAFSSKAYNFKSGDLCYNIISYTEPYTVEVTYESNDFSHETYSGLTSVAIPETVERGGKTYSVTSIGAAAFWCCSGLTSITIPNSVTSIGSQAFWCCSNITSIIFEADSKLTSIGPYAFDGCSGLTSVTIPNSVTNIDESAFRNCKNLKSVLFAKNSRLKSIGNAAFYECSGLTSIAIPDSVTRIGDNVFGYCNSLGYVTIPNSVTIIGKLAFDRIKIIIYGGNAAGSPWGALQRCYARDENFIYSDVAKTKIIKYIGKGTSVTIPNLVTSIDMNAFEGCRGLSSVSFEENSKLTSIGSKMFKGCTGLTSITIPNSVTSIKNEPFYGCNKLASITIPNSVTSIALDAFDGCDSITTVTYNTNAIGDRLSGIKSLKTVNIGDSVTSIGSSAFSGCSGLTSVNIPNSVTSIGSGAFRSCSGLTSITIPNSVTSIGNYAFEGCSGLTSVSFDKDSKLTSIGFQAFKGCTGLTSITIPNSVTSIDQWAFDGCDSITTLTYNTNAIGSIFLGIKSLKTVNIGDSVTSIGSGAFRRCSGLTSITIPNSVTSIGDYAFEGCSGLTSVSFEKDSKLTSIGFQAFKGCTGLTSITVPNSVTSIGGGAFEGCSGLTSITIPNSVTSIGNYAFEGCSGLTSASFEKDSKLTSIGYQAFKGCTGLTSITVPNSVTSIGYQAFEGCSGLTSASFEKNSKLTNIGEKAFSDCSGLTSINISNSATKIGQLAFSGIDTIFYGGKASGSPWGASIRYYTDNDIIYSNSGKTQIFKYIGQSASITIPNSVTSIDSNAFYGVGTVIYGGNATGSPWGASNVYYADERFAYSDTAKTQIFKYVGKDSVVTIPNSITSIGEKAFSDCSDLISVTFPKSITSIGEKAFSGCTKLNSITCYATTPPTLEPSAFPQNEMIVTVPCSHIAGYKKSDWGQYSDITFTEDFLFDFIAESTDDTLGTVEIVQQPDCGTDARIKATASEHYHFVNWSDGNIDNPRTITVTSDTTLMAMFAIDTLKVVVNAENGNVSGAGEYVYGTETILTATSAEHYHFAKWSDGNIDNPRTITVTSDTTLTAMFGIDTLKLGVNAENGTVSGAGEYAYGAETSLTATPAEHYHFAKWSDGNTENPRLVTVASDTILTAEFAIDTLKVTITAQNGTVEGAGEYAYGTNITLTATPAENYKFSRWSDGNTDNPRTITVTEDITLEAIFEQADAISANAVNAVNIYAHHNTIVVENADADIFVYDATGRLIARRDVACHVSITMPQQGIYIVKVGNDAKRVIVGY